MYERNPPRYEHVFCFLAKRMMMMFEVETTTKPRMSRTDEAVAAVPFPDLDPDRRIPAGLPNLYHLSRVCPLSRQNPRPSLPVVCHIGLSRVDGIRRPSFHSKCLSVPRCFRSFQRRQTDQRTVKRGSFTRQRARLNSSRWNFALE